MGFRNGAYATIWAVDPGKFANTSRVRLTTSRKNNQNNTYEQDFGGFCTFIGKASDAAQKLASKDRIKLISCEVTNKFVKEKNLTYTDYKVFEFEMADGNPAPTKEKAPAKKIAPIAEEGEVEEEDLPF